MSNTQIGLNDLYQLHANLKEGEVILDVRRPEEYKEAHIPNSLNVPVDELSGRTQDLKSYKKIFIHCKRGGRAKTAFELLQNAGLDNLVCVHDAGMDLWLEKNYPSVKG